MQTRFRKKILLFLFGLWAGGVATAQSTAELLRHADSLFAARQFTRVAPVYRQLAADNRPVGPALFLKLAYLNERQHRDAEALYYLNRYYERRPDEAVLRKMNELAQVHDWQGYELNDFNLLILLYKQYGLYLTGLLLVLAGYVFAVLLLKKIKHQYVPSRHKVVFLFYLLGIGILVNLPENYAVAIVRTPNALLRLDPSAAAPVTEAVGRGNRLSVLGNDDIWLRVVYNNQLAYVRERDVWLVK